MEELAQLTSIQLLEEIEYLAYQPSRKSNRKIADPFEISDKKFVKLFRINKPMADELIDRLTPFLIQRNRSLDPEIKFFAAIRHFASGSYQTDIGENKYIALSQPSVSRSIHEVINAVHESGLFAETIQFPTNLEKLQSNRQDFWNKHRFPGCIGCIDCTHVAIVPPIKGDLIYPEHIYVNRKGYHSVNTQLICNANKEIISVNAKFPGSTGDSYIWNKCNVKPVMIELHKRYPGQYYLLGDSGYANRPWLLIPLEDTIEGSSEERYNKRHMSTRTVIEHVNGILKMRWRCCLKHRVLHYHPEVASKIINTCAVLHNLCIRNKLKDVPPEREDDDPLEGLDCSINSPFMEMESENVARRVDPFLAEARLLQRKLVRNFFN